MSEYQKNTGEMPVPKGTNVDVIFRDGSKAWNVPAGEYISFEEAMSRHPDNSGYAEDWSITQDDFDIIQWRLAEAE